MDRLDVSGRKMGMDRHVARQAQEYVFLPKDFFPSSFLCISVAIPVGFSLANERLFNSSGRLNAADRELAELQAMAQRRLKSARVNFAQGVEDAKETRRDLDYCLDRTRYALRMIRLEIAFR